MILEKIRTINSQLLAQKEDIDSRLVKLEEQYRNAPNNPYLAAHRVYQRQLQSNLNQRARLHDVNLKDARPVTLPGQIEWPVESIQYLVDPLPLRTSDEVMQSIREQMDRDLLEMEAQA